MHYRLPDYTQGREGEWKGRDDYPVFHDDVTFQSLPINFEATVQVRPLQSVGRVNPSDH